MRIHIHPNHLDVSQQSIEAMKEKILHLEHYYENIIDAILYLREESDHQDVELKINVKDKELFIKEKGVTFQAALDVALDGMKKLLKKYKEKHAKNN
ncbi:MAG: HPF/RaiA family ribosome-associated protein [Bacteroidetes bacterium]|nr:HPF/RaiA family ribosome-associated protein [Bacteroidota bacterium]